MSKKILVLFCCFILLLSGCINETLNIKKVGLNLFDKPKKEHSFAYKIGKLGKIEPCKDIMPEEFEALKKENEENKEKYTQLKLYKKKSSLSAILGGTLLLGAAIGGFMLGIKSPPPGIAPVAAGVLEGAVTSSLVWELGGKNLVLSPGKMIKAKSIAGAVLLAWMPAEMAQNATEARQKFGQMVYNVFMDAYYREHRARYKILYRTKDFWLYKLKEKEIRRDIMYQQQCGFMTRKILAFQEPHFQRNTKISNIVDINYNSGAWIWDYQNPILFTRLSNCITASSEYNDLDFWHYISRHLPKWCFIWLPYNYKQGKMAMIYSDGEKFVNYPRIIWQGKDYFFVWNIANKN